MAGIADRVLLDDASTAMASLRTARELLIFLGGLPATVWPMMNDHIYARCLSNIDHLRTDLPLLNQLPNIRTPVLERNTSERVILIVTRTSAEARLVEIANQDRYLQDFGLTRRRVLGEKNCLFRAISLVLLGDEESYADLRATATEFMRDHLELFQDFFRPDNTATDPRQHMLQEMDRLSRNGVYAGQESVVALALALGVNIFVMYGWTI